MNSETIITAVITGLLTYFATQTKSRHELKGKQVESDSNTEGIYVQNMSTILEEYKEQVSGFRDEVSKLRKENKDIKREFREFKEQHYKELEEYKDFVGVLEVELEEVKTQRDDWKEKFMELKGVE